MQTFAKPSPIKEPGPPRKPNGRRPLSTKNGTIISAVVTAALAAGVIALFLNQYRNNVNSGGVPTAVLVADKLIEQGASGDSLGAQGLFKADKLPKDQLKPGAITDAADLKGQVAAADILPGQQLTRTDFRPAGSGTVTKLAADQRAITLSLDRAHGLLGPIRSGDHVDVYSGFLVDTQVGRPRPFLRLLQQNVLVLDAPAAKAAGSGVGTGANQKKEITLRVGDAAAPDVAFAYDNGKVWLVLRPLDGTELKKRPLVSLEKLLFDAPTVRANRGGSR